MEGCFDKTGWRVRERYQVVTNTQLPTTALYWMSDAELNVIHMKKGASRNILSVVDLPKRILQRTCFRPSISAQIATFCNIDLFRAGSHHVIFLAQSRLTHPHGTIFQKFLTHRNFWYRAPRSSFLFYLSSARESNCGKLRKCVTEKRIRLLHFTKKL